MSMDEVIEEILQEIVEKTTEAVVEQLVDQIPELIAEKITDQFEVFAKEIKTEMANQFYDLKKEMLGGSNPCSKQKR